MEGVACPEADVAVPARVAGVVGQLSGVVAVALGGSAGSGLADAASDLDFHVYWEAPLAPPDERAARLAAVADAGSLRVRDGAASWTLEDWFAVDGRAIELIYVAWGDVPVEIEWAYREGLTGEGFTTARLYNVARGRAFHDPAGLLGAVQERLNRAYPEATRAALLRRQPALLWVYLKQLRVAQGRGDLLFAQHRRYTLQMVFFDLLFALNSQYHPGEKRLLTHAARCPRRPVDCEARWARVAGLPADDPALAEELGALVEELCDLARWHGGVAIPDAPP